MTLLAACSGSEAEPVPTETNGAPELEPTSPAYWVQAYEGARAAASYDYLITCWAEQWPEGVKFSEGTGEDVATAEEQANAIAATRENCTLQMMVRLDQINIDLAREGLPVREIEDAAARQLDAELDEMFDEYWARL